MQAVWKHRAPTELRAAADIGVSYVDQLLWLCADDRCPSTIKQRIVYPDGTHLTREMSELLAPYLRASLS